MIYESEQLRGVTGPTIRPGGLSLTGRAMEFCHFPVRSRLLDVGCGEGTTVSYLRSRFQMNAFGVDISSLLLEDGKSLDGSLPLARGRAEELPFGDGTLDGILCECVFSLLPEPEKGLREFSRVLPKEGRLILSDIYLRNAGETSSNREEVVDPSLSGARPACAVQKLLGEAGFVVMLWEDHTPLLKELAARLVLAHGSADALWGGMKAAGCSGMGHSIISPLRPGYYLLVAMKK